MSQAKVETQMSKTDERSYHENGLDFHESAGLILKLYTSVLMNPRIQNGLRHIERLSQPLFDKYQEYVDDNLFKVKNKLAHWVSHYNTYSNLAGLWLLQNTPHSGEVVSKEKFLESFASIEKSHSKEMNKIPHIFYNIACSIWQSIHEPTADELKSAMLEIVAKTINKHLNLENEGLSNALFNMLKMLIDKKRELVPEESFVTLVRTYLGDSYWKGREEIITAACKEYYTFARRFVLIDFPLTTHKSSTTRLLVSMVKDRTYELGDHLLDMIEHRVDQALELLKVEHKPYAHAATLRQKASRVTEKIQLLLAFLFHKLTNRVKSSPLYLKADNYLHIENRIDDGVYLAMLGYTLVRENLLNPSVNFIKVNNQRLKDKITVTFSGLNIGLVRQAYNSLKQKYDILKKCTAVVHDEVVELTFDREALKHMCSDAKSELLRIYSELRTFEKDRIELVGNELYNKALDKFRRIHMKALGEPSPSLEYPRYDPKIVRHDVIETGDEVKEILKSEPKNEPVEQHNAQEEIREMLEEQNKPKEDARVEDSQLKNEWKEAEVQKPESLDQENNNENQRIEEGRDEDAENEGKDREAENDENSSH